MSDPDQIDEDEVLRRMLVTKPTPHKPLGAGGDRRRKKLDTGAERVGKLVKHKLVPEKPK